MPYDNPQGLDPAVVQAILQLQNEQPEQQRIARQQQLADALRADQRQGLQGIQAGRRYVGPGIANLAGNIGQSFMAAKQAQQADTANKALGTSREAAMRQFFDALTKRNAMVTNNSGASGVGGYGSAY